MARYSKLSRLYLNQKLEISNIIAIEGDNFNYLKSVMRMKPDMEIRVFNESDGEFVAIVIEISKKSLNIKIAHKLREAAAETRSILALSVIKPDKFLQAAMGAASLGLKKIVPIITQNTQYKDINEERLGRCLIETIQQCERMQIPEIAPALPLPEFIESYSEEQIFFADEHSSSDDEGYYIPLEQIQNIRKINCLNSPIVLIGPEGGFTEKERDLLFRQSNIRSICLGDSVLRSELATISAFSLVQLLRNKREGAAI